MRCPTPDTLLSLLRGNLEDAESEELEAHLSGCNRCEQEFERIIKSENAKWGTWKSVLDASTVAHSSTAAVSLSEQGLLQFLAELGFTDVTEIGRGGMGVVLKARHVKLDRLVAIKMLADGALAGPERRQRLIQEAQAISHLRHPHILQIYDVGEFQGIPFLILEYIEGSDLRTRLQSGPLSERDALQISLQAASAVQHAHAAGIVHRDIKPSNILLEDEQVHLADFGLAKIEDNENSLTHSSALLGTPAYMAPEQATARSHDVGPATDVYSLGVVLYEMLCGRPPFVSSNPAETLQLIAEQEPVPLRRLQPKLNRDLETICLKCLTKEIDSRYESASELHADLLRFQSGHPILARPISNYQRVLKWAKRSPLAASLTAVTACITGVLIWTWAAFTLELKSQRDEISKQKSQLEVESKFADQNFARAHQAIKNYLESFRSHTPLGSKDNLAFQEETIGTGIEFYEQLIKESNGHDPARKPPLNLVDAMLDHAELYIEYGKVKLVSDELLESVEAYQASARICKQVASETNDYVPRAVKLQGIVQTSLVTSFRKLGNHQQALVAADNGLKCYEAMIEAGELSGGYANWYQGMAWMQISKCQMALGELGNARESLDSALSFVQDLPSVWDFLLTKGEILIARCRLELSANNLSAAKKYGRISNELFDKLCAHASESLPRYDLRRARSYREIARVHAASKQLLPAFASYQQAILILVDLEQRFPTVEQFESELDAFIDEALAAAETSGPIGPTKMPVVDWFAQFRTATKRDKTDSTTRLPEARVHLQRGHQSLLAANFETAVSEFETARELLSRANRPSDKETSPRQQQQAMEAMEFRVSRGLAESHFALSNFEAAGREIERLQLTRSLESNDTLSIQAVSLAMCGRLADARQLLSHYKLQTEVPSLNAYVGFIPLVSLLAAEGSEDTERAKVILQLQQMLTDRDELTPFQRAQLVRALRMAHSHLTTSVAADDQDSSDHITWCQEAALSLSNELQQEDSVPARLVTADPKLASGSAP